MKTQWMISFIAGLVLGASVMTPAQAVTYTSAPHTFSVNDVQGDFEGHTFGGTTTSDGNIPADSTIICGIDGGAQCPLDIAPITDTKLLPNQSITLYPVDSTFGYEVVDFLGAAQKTRDNDYLEGFVGNITSGFPTSAVIDGVTVTFNPPITGGIAVSNAATEVYKVKPPMGTWCRGLGGNSVKCETEHYSVMEHILSCHEIIPYFFADPLTGVQAVLNEDGAIADLGSFDCANAGLDDVALIMVGGVLGPQLVDGTPCDAVNDPPGCQMFPNDKTSTLDNVALTTDYSVQLKDDGKALYGWGTIHKRPNDIRMYASLPVPQEWRDNPNTKYVINSAKLIVRHHITNNPNDQLRPEDLENEAATGRKPSYNVEGTIGGADEVWKASKACFEGDSDLIDTEDGNVDPTFIGVGTYFKNTPFAITSNPPLSPIDPAPPYPFSSDLTGALTNAWYTTIDRDPFEWSYDMNPDPTIQEFEGTWIEDDGTLTGAGGTLISGPRWRLRPNKYGQDLPGLEITKDVGSEEGLPPPPEGADCYPPPFEKALIKYPVGEPTITEINLLDWNRAANGPSPLDYSDGWMDVLQNGFVTVAGYNNGVPYTTNGLPMSDDFDLAVYIKGDRKATAVYDAWLEIDYEVAPTVVVPDIGVCETLDSVYATLIGAGLTVNPIVLTEATDACPAGLVTRTIPPSGTIVDIGSEVTIVVATEPEPGVVAVPDIGVCETLDSVYATLIGAGLTVDPIVKTDATDACAAGLVTRTEPPVGTLVAVGSMVTIVVATEPVADLSDVSITGVQIPASAARIGTVKTLFVTVTNAATAAGAGTGTVTLTGTDGSVFIGTFANLVPGASQPFSWLWTVPSSQTVVWTIEVTVNGVVVDSATRTTTVR